MELELTFFGWSFQILDGLGALILINQLRDQRYSDGIRCTRAFSPLFNTSLITLLKAKLQMLHT